MQVNDEVSTELRSLQMELREVIATNKFRKARLLQVARAHMARQEYNQVLDDINKAIEQAYSKRFVS